MFAWLRRNPAETALQNHQALLHKVLARLAEPGAARARAATDFGFEAEKFAAKFGTPAAFLAAPAEAQRLYWNFLYANARTAGRYREEDAALGVEAFTCWLRCHAYGDTANAAAIRAALGLAD